MYSDKDIQNLDKLKEGVVFPKPSHPSFDQFREELLKALWFNDVGKDWEWDIEAQVFTCRLEKMAAIGGMLYTACLTLHIDPKKPLADEIVRVRKEQDTFHVACMNGLAQLGL